MVGGLVFLHLVLLLQNDPIILIVMVIPIILEKFLEHGLVGAVGGLLIKLQTAALGEIVRELAGIAFAENLYGSGQFLLLDAVVLVPLVVCLESLPRQHTSQEVHGDVANSFHVVPARLFNPRWVLMEA